MTGRRSFPFQFIHADAAWFAVAAMVAFAVGVAGDQLLRQAPLGLQYRSPAQVSVQSSEIQFVGIEQMDELLARPDVVTLDARPREIFELGHIPGARSLSREQFAADFSALETELRKTGQTLVVYCADVSCPDGAIVARNLQDHGFSKILVFEGGYEEWETAGRPTEP